MPHGNDILMEMTLSMVICRDGLPGGLPKGGDGYAIIGAMPHEVMALCKGKMTKRIQPQAILREDKGEIGSVVEFIEQCRNQPEKLEPINLQDELKVRRSFGPLHTLHSSVHQWSEGLSFVLPRCKHRKRGKI